MMRPMCAIAALMAVGLTSLVSSPAAGAAYRATDGRCPAKPFIHAYDGWCYAIDWWNHSAADGGHVYSYGRPSIAHQKWCKAAYPRYNPATTPRATSMAACTSASAATTEAQRH